MDSFEVGPVIASENRPALLSNGPPVVNCTPLDVPELAGVSVMTGPALVVLILSISP
jgi:hypothetical protein